jgi:hypothetical protein
MDEEVRVGVGPAECARHAGGDGPTPEHRRRMSAGRKQQAVLRLLRGEELVPVSEWVNNARHDDPRCLSPR